MVIHQTNLSSKAGEERYRHLFEHFPICIFIADLTVVPTTILDANHRTELVYGYTAAELVGKPAAQLVFEDARPAILNIVQRVQQGETVTAETINQRRDGTTFPVRVVATLDPSNSGRMITVVEDITAEKQRRSETEAIDAERHRIAHEIHDGVAQSLAGLRFKSALWHHLAENAPPEMRSALEELLTVLNDAITDLRRSIYALRPVDLESGGFFTALENLLGDFGDHYQVAAVLETPRPLAILPAVYELPLFRIIQEGLHNIGQHAQASSALVRVIIDDAGGVTVTIRDNGLGFNPSQVNPSHPAGHFGLRQMRERILSLGGTLDIHSIIGQGTELVITLPSVARGGRFDSD